MWQQTIEAYNLKWSHSDSLALFHSITSENTSLATMLQWVRNSIKKIPETYANIIIFNTLTGLRPSEACISIGLIQNDLTNYYNKEKSILEHLRFPEFFIRRTKKSYISIVNDLIIDIAKKAYEKPSYNALKLLLSRKGLDAKMYYCRKVFATWLRNNSIEPEVIDLLQGRIGKSVFVKYYYKPDFISNQARIVEPKLRLVKYPTEGDSRVKAELKKVSRKITDKAEGKVIDIIIDSIRPYAHQAAIFMMKLVSEALKTTG